MKVALSLAGRGFRVFPLNAGAKDPLRTGWQTAATADVFTVLNTWPAGAYNVGIATGRDFIVVDVDPKRGGLHFYFEAEPSMPVRNSVNKLGQGIDIRGYGGYVVGPGSIINAVTYEIERDFTA